MNESDTIDLIRRSKKDLYTFCKHILGFSRMSKEPHLDLCKHIRKKGKRKKLSLLPRNSFKSSIITVGNSIFSIINNPDIRILIASETQKNSIKYVREIRSQFEENQKLRAAFGDYVGKNNWREYEITVNKRTRSQKEATVTASSLEKGTSVGMHYDLIILDDVVSRNNINNPEQIAKTLDYYRLLMSILDPEGVVLINGTRWSIEDLYGWILNPENEEHSQFDIFTRQAINNDGSLLMGNVLTKEFLDEQRITQGEAIFNAQYQNNPITGENAVFREDQISYYEKSPGNLYYFMSLDPALSLKKRGDYSGLIVNGVDYKGNWWIQEAFKVKLTPDELITLIFELAEKYQPLMALGIEKFVLEQFLKILMNNEMEKRKFVIPLQEVPTNSKVSKETRIKALQPKFENKEIFVKKEHIDLINEIIFYPQVKHDDLLDALKTQLQIAFPSDKPILDELADNLILNEKEKKIWNHVKNLGTRKIRRQKEWTEG